MVKLKRKIYWSVHEGIIDIYTIFMLTHFMLAVTGGEHLDGMVKLLPVGKVVSLREDCDWIDSPARPQYIY